MQPGSAPTPEEYRVIGGAMTTRLASLRPFRQGELDGLCGVYAIINAVRFALRSDTKLQDDDWSDLFAELLVAADDMAGAAAVTTSGITAQPLRSLLKTAAAFLSDHRGLDLVGFRPVKALAPRTMPQILTYLESHLRQPRTAALVEVGGRIHHWSVVASVESRFLNLFDSSGHDRLRIDRCWSSFERKMTANVEHVIGIHSLLRISD
jgi:hypothetical protein